MGSFMRAACSIALLTLLSGCADLPGACEQSIAVGGVKYGFCYEVEDPGQCPTKESGDDNDEYRWFFYEGESCELQGYPFDCGSGLWEDIETDCPEGF